MSLRKDIFVTVCRGILCAAISLLLIGLLAIGMHSCTPAPAVAGHFPAGVRPAGFVVIIAGSAGSGFAMCPVRQPAIDSAHA
jgi:hypothetical protein